MKTLINNNDYIFEYKFGRKNNINILTINNGNIEITTKDINISNNKDKINDFNELLFNNFNIIKNLSINSKDKAYESDYLDEFSLIINEQKYID